MTTINSGLELKQGVLWKCVERTETGYLYRLRKKYTAYDLNFWGIYPYNKAEYRKQIEIFPHREEVNPLVLHPTAEKLREFGYRYFEKNGTYFLELPCKEYLASRVQEKWPEMQRTIGNGDDSFKDFLQHLFVLSDGEQFVSDHAMQAIPTLIEMLDSPDYVERRERLSSVVEDFSKRLHALERKYGDGVRKLKAFVDLIVAGLGSSSSEIEKNFIQMLDGSKWDSSLLRGILTHFSMQRAFIMYWQRKFHEKIDIEALLKIADEAFAKDTDDLIAEATYEEEFSLLYSDETPLEDPHFQAFIVKHASQFFKGIPFLEIKSLFQNIPKIPELSAWMEREKQALQKKQGVMWEALRRVQTKAGYIYTFRYRTELHAVREEKRLEITPAVEPTDYDDTLLINSISLFKEFGFAVKRDESDLYITLPDRDHLQASLERLYPELNETIISSEGIADDISFLQAFLNHFLLISEDGEFVHDIMFHVLPTLKFIKNEGLESFKSTREISRNLIRKQLEKVTESQILENDATFKDKILTMMGAKADVLWAVENRSGAMFTHKQLAGGSSLWRELGYQRFWQRTYREEIDQDSAHSMWDRAFPIL